MKELTIEQKAQRYDEALEKAKNYHSPETVCNVRIAMENLFPELKKSEGSEDEKIRKGLIGYFLAGKCENISSYHGISTNDILAWLEKQGEHAKFRDSIQVGDKVTRNEDGMLVNLSQLKRVAKPSDKVEPKFKHGDRVRNKKSGLEQTLGSCTEDVYEGAFPFRTKDQDDWELVEQKSADRVEPKFRVKYAGSEYNVLEVKDIAGITYYGIEDEPNHIDYVRINHCEIVSEQKSADEVKPKFHEGEWIIHYGTENIYQVVAVIDNRYQLKYGDNYTIQNCADVDRCARLWDITKDAKDGDVLVDEDNNIGIYKEIEGICWHSYIYLGCDNRLYGFRIGGSHIQNNTKPATKEQRDTLEKAMADAGYTFDFENKELKKIEQTSTWSEEDEQMIESIIQLLYDTKSENCWNCIFIKIKDKRKEITFTSIENWLKSLKERYCPHKWWKPTEEQMETIKSVLEPYPTLSPREIHNLKELLEQLKKLREE